MQKRTRNQYIVSAVLYYILFFGKIFGGQNFSAGQNFRHQVEISAVLSEIFNQFPISPYNLQEKYFNMSCIYLTCFRFQRTKYFGGLRSSVSQNVIINGVLTNRFIER